jgi:hypothetical protein
MDNRETLTHPVAIQLSRGICSPNATDLDDLVRFWNIRAADIRLHCVDPAHLPRYTATIPELGTAKRRHSAYSAMRAERRRSRFP